MVDVVDRLVSLVWERFRPVLGDDGRAYVVSWRVPAVVVPVTGGRGGLRSWLAAAYVEAYGRPPAGRALTAALGAVAWEASQGVPEPVAYRVGRCDGRVVVDLGDPDGVCVVVDPAGWWVTVAPPVLFRRSALTGRLPMPAGGGDLAELRQLARLGDPAGWRLVVAWLVAALADVEAPVLALTGGPGAGKSTVGRMLVELVDPSPAPLRRPPRDARSWATVTAGSWVVALDDVAPVSGWLADVLARTVTGEGIICRRGPELVDVDVTCLRRPVLVTARHLDPPGVLAGRLAPVALAPIPPDRRRAETDLRAGYERARGRLLGALFDVVARLLAVDEALDPPGGLDPGPARPRPPSRPGGQGSSGLEGVGNGPDIPRNWDSPPRPRGARGPGFAGVLAVVDDVEARA